MKKTRGQLERDDRNALKALDWLVRNHKKPRTGLIYLVPLNTLRPILRWNGK